MNKDFEHLRWSKTSLAVLSLMRLIGAFLIVFLVGCSHNPSQRTTQGRLLPLGEAAYLEVEAVWPLALQGTYLQHLASHVRGKEHILTVHVTLEPAKIEALAFNDVLGRLYHLCLAPQKLTWKTSPSFPSQVRPEHILADFLLVHLSKEKLHTALRGARLREEKQGEVTKRFIENDNGILREILLTRPLGTMWGYAELHHPSAGYTLKIKTLTLP